MLIDQKTKKIMEECKERARAAGLKIYGDTLEYIVTNKELLELEPKLMIPTLYDYWVHDLEVIKNKWMYDAYPHNPYETVINTRPAISFYNDNNPDWLNIMIFYHVIAHIDYFQNNVFYKRTWNDDFCSQALADKRLINRIREELGSEKRWVDYVIEFSRQLDNLVGYYREIEEEDYKIQLQNLYGISSEKLDFYFGKFLKRLYEQGVIDLKFYYEEIDRYNQCLQQFSQFGEKIVEKIFFENQNFRFKFPQFQSAFTKYLEKKEGPKDILDYLLKNSEFLNKEKNRWMKEVIEVVRRTSLYFQPQFRDHICNEGWASYWHYKLFMTDERIKGHEVDFAKVNANVLVNPRIGVNPYIIGMYLWEFIEEMAKKGKFSREYQLLEDIEARKKYDKNLGEQYGKEFLFKLRENVNDFLLVNFLSDKDFQDFVDRYNLFVAGVRLHPNQPGLAQVYIKSKDGKAYRNLLNRLLYHPPNIVINPEEKMMDEDELYLDHIYEGRTLVTKYIPAVLIGLNFLWGREKKVHLETTEFEVKLENDQQLILFRNLDDLRIETRRIRVLYTCQEGKIEKEILGEEEV
jgi:stage V sporulation protein R